MTGFVDGLVALAIAGVLNVVIALRIQARNSVSEASFLVRVFWGTLLLRYTLALVLNGFADNSAFASMFWGDSNTYDAGGHALSLVWQGEAIGAPSITGIVGRFGFYYFVGVVYFLFGRNQLLVQFLNGTIGAVTVLVMHALALRLFGIAVARRVALLMAFFPGMVFWSAGMYKDPAILLCIAVSMYAVVRLGERLSLAMLLLFMAAVLALMTLRFYVAYFVIFATLTSFAFSGRGSALPRAVSYTVLAVSLLAALTFVVRQEALEEQRTLMTLERVQQTRADQAKLAQSGFGREFDVSTAEGAILALPVGLTYLLFAPFPWAVVGTRQALVLPEMVVWYGLMPAFFLGLTRAVRRQLGDVLPILAFATSLTLAYALMQGNVGTAYRQRTQVTMFYFLFMGVGLGERAKPGPLRSARTVMTQALPR